MEITNEVMDKKLTVKVAGRLDTTTAPQLESFLQENLDGVEELVLDFSELEYISSAGLRVLLATQKRMNQQGSVCLCGVCDVVMEVLELTGFSDILTIK